MYKLFFNRSGKHAPCKELDGKKKITHDTEGIEELIINGERIIETVAQIANLKNSEAISGRNAGVNIEKNWGGI